MERESGLALVVSVDLKKVHQFIKSAAPWEEFEDGSLEN